MAPTFWVRVLVPLLGLVGLPVLIAGFVLNPGPPAGASLAQMTAFGATHVLGVLLGGWLQVTDTVMAGIFALCVVSAAGTATRLAGLLTLFGVTLPVSIGLAEMTGYGLVTSVARSRHQLDHTLRKGCASPGSAEMMQPKWPRASGQQKKPRRRDT